MSPARRPRDVHILCVATFMTVLDVFIVNVALTDIGKGVGGGSLGNLSWVLNAYAIVFAALLVPAGRLGDRYDNKQVFLTGLLLFILRSARHPAPEIDPALFRSRVFASANVSILLIQGAFGIQLLGLVLWMQRGWHYTALQTGLLVAPGPAMVAITALGLRRLLTALPDGPVAAAGALLVG